MNNDKFMLIAHRGASYEAPENTIAAVNLAWKRNVDAVEVDVHLSKDNRIVVIHNSNTWKTGGKYKKIQNQTLEELKRLDVGKYKGEQWAHERIPTLEEVLETIPQGKTLFIEIKCGSEILPPLTAVLHRSHLCPEQVKLIGFKLDTMAEAKKSLPQHEVFFLFNIKMNGKNNTIKPELDEMLAKAQRANADGLDVWACRAVDKTFVSKVKAVGMKLYVWTVNDPLEAKRFVDVGVDGITTDRPQWLKMKLQEVNFMS